MATPRSVEGLAALGGFSVVVLLASMVVPLCDAVGAIVVPVAWDEPFEVAMEVFMVCVLGAVVTAVIFVVRVIVLLEDSFSVNVHVPFIHVPFVIAVAWPLLWTAFSSPWEVYMHCV